MKIFISLLILLPTIISIAALPPRGGIEAAEIRAADGDAGAAMFAGKYYYNGMFGSKPDPVKAAKYLEFAALKGGYSSALYNLGMIRLNGEGGTAPDRAAAVLMLCEAAMKGHEMAVSELEKLGENPEALSALGTCRMTGKGIACNPEEAVGLWRRAAELGSPSALFNLGLACATGSGVPADPQKAVQYWKKSAESGYGPAFRSLEKACMEGYGGMKKDPGGAAKWRRKADEWERNARAEHKRRTEEAERALSK